LALLLGAEVDGLEEHSGGEPPLALEPHSGGEAGNATAEAGPPLGA
jgi:hypothetical protein